MLIYWLETLNINKKEKRCKNVYLEIKTKQSCMSMTCWRNAGHHDDAINR